MVASENPEPETHVVMFGDHPMAASSSLEEAKANAFARGSRYGDAEEYHWSEYRPGVWRLMARAEGRQRFAWTHDWVVTVPTVPAEGEVRLQDAHAAQVRAATLTDAIAVARGEYLADETGDPEDDAYNRGVSDVIAVLGALLESAPAAQSGGAS